MIAWFGRHLRWLAFSWAILLCISMLVLGMPAQSAIAAGNGVNVILMIGDGLGWEMARAAAVAKGTPLYKSGKGKGLSFQNLAGYAQMTTYGTTIAGPTLDRDDNPVLDANGNPVIAFNTGNSALDGSNPLTGASPVRPGFAFKPLPFNPGTRSNGGSTDLSLGNLVGYEPQKGGSNPWTPLSPAQAAASGYDKEYIKYSVPDSANTATSLYTGVKTYNNALGVDIFEKSLTTILQTAAKLGKATGVVTSVPITHATPGAAISSVNRRSKYDSEAPVLDSILQDALLEFKPTVLLGGGHPMDFQNTTNVGPVFDYTYIEQATYDTLKANPTNNRYGYTFLERGPDAAAKLLDTAKSIEPESGDRLLGLYGARGQNGNLPRSSANGDYRTTGLDNFSLFSSATATANLTPGIPQPDTIRPLAPGETDAQFIAREVDENPTLADLTTAALEVVSKDKDGFWMMVEGGDIDWAAHDNNIDNLIGTMNSFDKAVQTTIDWIGKNGGWRKNLLIVSADHDHYLTLNDNFPELLKAQGADALTFTNHTPVNAGHFWGSDPNVKYGWGSHTNRMVPVYYQGGTSTLTQFIGKGFKSYGFDVPGVPGAVDQVHIYQVMLNTLTAPVRRSN
ncbi:alkaline phosphatase [Chlorogloea sp. CCALA 695]|uniref:alkaline phosphatase n=1 Tax=Chlorogloea sp. CCALA 695 TaxID=2107693 RepID=UPI000D0805AC|nr:alkaline phosphatase [Chlorogloea sp. CCALA 695]PSB29163.1 alkaline phosphatase [Chlorogloea sp. CCALA 695]